MSKLYYTAPQDSIFEEVKQRAIELWTERYPESTSPFYAKEKIDRIKYLANISDNLMYIVAMFDDTNRHFLSLMLTVESREAIRLRMVDGGMPAFMCPF